MRRALPLLALLASATAHAAPETWGGLDPGPHAVGFRQLELVDHARPFRGARRLDGTPRAGERGRPLRISVWYPAQEAAGPALTVGDYVALMGVEDRLGPVTPERAQAGREAFFAFELIRDLDAPRRARLLALPGAARRDAPAARGRFPVVLYSLGSAAVGHATPEYLASHGYVVAQAPRLGPGAGYPPEGFGLLDLTTKVQDLEQTLNALAAVPGADLDNVSALGFSAGGRWALQLAMQDPALRAVVSLDSVMLFDDPVTQAWRQSPRFDLERVRVPVLHVIRKAWVPNEDASMWQKMRFAERTTMRFDDPALTHLDFQSAGLAQVLAGGRPDKARAVRAAFLAWNHATLAFLDAHQKDREEARRLLARAPGGAIAVTRLPAEAAPLAAADFFSAIAEEGPAAAVRAARAAGKAAVAENDLNLAGYAILLAGRPAEALPLFELLVEWYPASANAHDSLADALVAGGDRERARAETERAQQLLDADREMPAARRAGIQKSIDDRRARLR